MAIFIATGNFINKHHYLFIFVIKTIGLETITVGSMMASIINYSKDHYTLKYLPFGRGLSVKLILLRIKFDFRKELTIMNIA